MPGRAGPEHLCLLPLRRSCERGRPRAEAVAGKGEWKRRMDGAEGWGGDEGDVGGGVIFFFFLFFKKVFLSRETAAQTIFEEVGKGGGRGSRRRDCGCHRRTGGRSWDGCGRSGAAAAAARSGEQLPPPREPEPPLLQWVQPGSRRGSGGRRRWSSSHGGFAFAPRRGQGQGLG